MASSLSLSTLETRIYNLIVAGLDNYSATNVIWARQSVRNHRPDSDKWISLDARIYKIARDWLDVEDAANPSPGEEITHYARGPRVLEVDVTVFDTTARTSNGCLSELHHILSMLELPAQKRLMDLGNFSLPTYGPIRLIDNAYSGAVIESRAMCMLSGFIAHEITEDGTYIQIVSGTNVDGEAYSHDSGA